MEKKVLTEIAIYYGEVKRPKGHEVNNHEIKADILEAQLQNKLVSDSPFSYRFFDYKLNYSPNMGYVNEHICEYMNVKHSITLQPELSFGNILQYREQSFSRRCLEMNDLKNEPTHTMVYGVDIQPESAQVVIEYDDNKAKDKTWFYELKTNEYIVFPTSCRYFLAGNTSKEPNFFLTTTFKEI